MNSLWVPASSDLYECVWKSDVALHGKLWLLILESGDSMERRKVHGRLGAAYGRGRNVTGY